MADSWSITIPQETPKKYKQKSKCTVIYWEMKYLLKMHFQGADVLNIAMLLYNIAFQMHFLDFGLLVLFPSLPPTMWKYGITSYLLGKLWCSHWYTGGARNDMAGGDGKLGVWRNGRPGSDSSGIKGRPGSQGSVCCGRMCRERKRGMLISTKDLLPHISDVWRVSSQPP